MKKRSKQYKQNQMFANNRKKFFRNLGKEQVPVEKPPKKERRVKIGSNRMPTLGGHNDELQTAR